MASQGLQPEVAGTSFPLYHVQRAARDYAVVVIIDHLTLAYALPFLWALWAGRAFATLLLLAICRFAPHLSVVRGTCHLALSVQLAMLTLANVGFHAEHHGAAIVEFATNPLLRLAMVTGRPVLLTTAFTFIDIFLGVSFWRNAQDVSWEFDDDDRSVFAIHCSYKLLFVAYSFLFINSRFEEALARQPAPAEPAAAAVNGPEDERTPGPCIADCRDHGPPLIKTVPEPAPPVPVCTITIKSGLRTGRWSPPGASSRTEIGFAVVDDDALSSCSIPNRLFLAAWRSQAHRLVRDVLRSPPLARRAARQDLLGLYLLCRCGSRAPSGKWLRFPSTAAERVALFLGRKWRWASHDDESTSIAALVGDGADSGHSSSKDEDASSSGSVTGAWRQLMSFVRTRCPADLLTTSPCDLVDSMPSTPPIVSITPESLGPCSSGLEENTAPPDLACRFSL